MAQIVGLEEGMSGEGGEGETIEVKSNEWKLAMILQKTLDQWGFGSRKFIPVYAKSIKEKNGSTGIEEIKGHAIVLVRNAMQTIGALEFQFTEKKEGTKVETCESLVLWFFQHNLDNYRNQQSLRNIMAPFEITPNSLKRMFDASEDILTGTIVVWTDNNGRSGGQSKNFQFLTDQHWGGFTLQTCEEQMDRFLVCLKGFHVETANNVQEAIACFDENSASEQYIACLKNWKVVIGDLPSCYCMRPSFSDILCLYSKN